MVIFDSAVITDHTPIHLTKQNLHVAKAKLTHHVSGECSANRPNSGVEVVVQCEGNSSEGDVEVVCEGAVSAASSNVRHMASEERIPFEMPRTKNHCNACLSHAREKFSRVNACEVSVLFTHQLSPTHVPSGG